jgi:hypothetical protein
MVWFAFIVFRSLDFVVPLFCTKLSTREVNRGTVGCTHCFVCSAGVHMQELTLSLSFGNLLFQLLDSTRDWNIDRAANQLKRSIYRI